MDNYKKSIRTFPPNNAESIYCFGGYQERTKPKGWRDAEYEDFNHEYDDFGQKK